MVERRSEIQQGLQPNWRMEIQAHLSGSGIVLNETVLTSARQVLSQQTENAEVLVEDLIRAERTMAIYNLIPNGLQQHANGDTSLVLDYVGNPMIVNNPKSHGNSEN